MKFPWWHQKRDRAGLTEAKQALAESSKELEEAVTLRTEATVRRVVAGDVALKLREIRMSNHITPSLFPPERPTQ